MLAGPSPEALIGPIAAATSHIRVGSGGVMLPHYSPFKVAESFSLLSGLFPGRIDLALGRAAGTDPLTTFALQRDRRQAAPDDFPQQLIELLGYLDDRLPADHPFARLAKTLPGRPERPEPWLLGSSQQSAIWAAELGLPYAFADFINPKGAEITALYHERFAEHEHAGADGNVGGGVSGGAGEGGGGSADEGEGTSGGAGEGGSASGSGGGRPRVAVGVWVICAETDEEAQRLAASGRMTFTLLRRGQLIAVPPPERAVEFFAAEERSSAPGQPRSQRRAIVGAPATVRAELKDVVAKYKAEEAIVLSITYAHEARRRSYELLAEEFGLGG
jgi:alkanesulfonate monooxygenase SsuD/methylene tetrahydromethanopterin reductase-like flavin-dependent oxidoreductase (luciferase family)